MTESKYLYSCIPFLLLQVHTHLLTDSRYNQQGWVRYVHGTFRTLSDCLGCQSVSFTHLFSRQACFGCFIQQQQLG
jgi:hypothetical protein